MNDESLQFAKALADGTRQEILRQLCCRWLTVNALVLALEGQVRQPTVSHHLGLLEGAGLVRVRQRGRHRHYTLNQARLTTCCGELLRVYAPDYDLAPVRANDEERELT
ncbi:MAG: winged helix-turn-helix transcriptional regulator [Anaerolineae bacterium]|nr:winged helix-turn-helix transcriptional regulator [Anaerolineae bacterium]